MVLIKEAKNFKYSPEILKLRNKNYVNSNSFNKKKIDKKSHQIWFGKYINTNKILVVLKKKIFIGYIRIEKKNRIISWAIYKKYWGKINFYKILKKNTKKNDLALINTKNISSLIIALKAGFKITKFDKKFLTLKK